MTVTVSILAQYSTGLDLPCGALADLLSVLKGASCGTAVSLGDAASDQQKHASKA